MAGSEPGDFVTELGYMRGVLTKLAPRPQRPDTSVPPPPGYVAAADVVTSTLEEELGRRRMLAGRLAAVFYVGSGLLGLLTLPLPAPGEQRAALALVSVAALIVGIVIWLAPWGR